MAGKKQCRPLTLRALARQRVDYSFTPAEHTRLYEELLLDPAAVLAVCLQHKLVLGELPCYKRICISHPDLARDVAALAERMGVVVCAGSLPSLPSPPA